MAEHKYDVFISYRRNGGAQYARILQLMLAQRGYKVFLDYDELKEGRFSDRIKAAIEDAPVFMLVLSKDSLERCVNDGDWVREEIMHAYERKKTFIPVDPDKTFDGVKADVPKEVREVAEEYQRSEINFGQTLGATVDQMIKDSLVPTLGERTPEVKLIHDGEAARAEIERRDRHRRFVRRVVTTGTIIVVLLVLATCLFIWNDHQKAEKKYAEQMSLDSMRNELEKKYRDFKLVLTPGLTAQQMGTIDTLLTNMTEVKPGKLWMSQYEFTIGQWHGILGGQYPAADKNKPMTDVSFGEVNMMLLDSLRDMTNIEFDLPSAEEWQFAAHGGNNHETTTFSGSNNPDLVAWYRSNSGGAAHPSDGQQGKEPNTLDLYDMSGNVSELCNSPFVGGKDGAEYTICGGNYNSPIGDIAVSSKAAFGTDEKDKTVGFRIVIRKE